MRTRWVGFAAVLVGAVVALGIGLLIGRLITPTGHRTALPPVEHALPPAARVVGAVSRAAPAGTGAAPVPVAPAAALAESPSLTPQFALRAPAPPSAAVVDVARRGVHHPARVRTTPATSGVDPHPSPSALVSDTSTTATTTSGSSGPGPAALDPGMSATAMPSANPGAGLGTIQFIDPCGHTLSGCPRGVRAVVGAPTVVGNLEHQRVETLPVTGPIKILRVDVDPVPGLDPGYDACNAIFGLPPDRQHPQLAIYTSRPGSFSIDATQQQLWDLFSNPDGTNQQAVPSLQESTKPDQIGPWAAAIEAHEPNPGVLTCVRFPKFNEGPDTFSIKADGFDGSGIDTTTVSGFSGDSVAPSPGPFANFMALQHSCQAPCTPGPHTLVFPAGPLTMQVDVPLRTDEEAVVVAFDQTNLDAPAPNCSSLDPSSLPPADSTVLSETDDATYTSSRGVWPRYRAFDLQLGHATPHELCAIWYTQSGSRRVVVETDARTVIPPATYQAELSLVSSPVPAGSLTIDASTVGGQQLCHATPGSVAPFCELSTGITGDLALLTVTSGGVAHQFSLPLRTTRCTADDQCVDSPPDTRIQVPVADASGRSVGNATIDIAWLAWADYPNFDRSVNDDVAEWQFGPPAHASVGGASGPAADQPSLALTNLSSSDPRSGRGGTTLAASGFAADGSAQVTIAWVANPTRFSGSTTLVLAPVVVTAAPEDPGTCGRAVHVVGDPTPATQGTITMTGLCADTDYDVALHVSLPGRGTADYMNLTPRVSPPDDTVGPALHVHTAPHVLQALARLEIVTPASTTAQSVQTAYVSINGRIIAAAPGRNVSCLPAAGGTVNSPMVLPFPLVPVGDAYDVEYGVVTSPMALTCPPDGQVLSASGAGQPSASTSATGILHVLDNLAPGVTVSQSTPLGPGQVIVHLVELAH